ncbi:sodium- and chloride-dependent neutral and basic amino acid transporter B(0+)-like isoform X2 [Mya arenaria]|nr:sodium- and chloride-dependent neutral and basic amino acid transporter B(0+)-like isoform X2 [Mya arenaria]XP_052802358.1 sodium- and chloride-dependent neutral and basic amino acid transporter B(0+)-like isoform X2 [Mya arenaria]XP_052802362.1 sodium- and chloride-dependent neutral and basic amino acid transporter B(0+)-like isoform X2 [Mya arenaria]XP_052802364.1 sodium- and chloride-dependent neutral and basic amino acid transporter B(0+)-like isoform X2 [Mya arenaria]
MEYPDTVSVSSSGHQQQRKAVKFSSTFSTYMTLLGYALGFADIWRFPFLVYRNGGGAFLIPFVIMTFVCGVPLFFMEYTISKFSGRGPYQVWDFCPLLRGVGITVSLAYLLYMIGSSIFRCWLFEFVFYSFYNPIPFPSCNNPWNTNTCMNGTSDVDYSASSMVNANMTTMNMKVDVSTSKIEIPRMSAAEEFWQFQALKMSTGIDDYSHFIWKYVVMMLVFRIIVSLTVVKSIKTIEKVIYVTLTLPFLFSVALFIRSLLLPGSADGIYFYFYPNFATLLKPGVWIEATLMVFYSFAFGWGAIMVMGSHALFRDNSYRTTIVITFTDSIVAIFNGMVCFSVLGNMAHTYGMPISELVKAGFSTGLVAYITALSSLPLPQLWTFLFLLSGILTGLEAQMIPIEMIIQVIGDFFPRLKAGFRIPTLIVITVVMFVLSLPTCTGAGAYIFLLIDWYAGSWTGTIVALIEVISISWVYGLDRLSEDTQVMLGRPLYAVFRWLLAFISPAIVLVILFLSCVEYVPPNYGSYHYPGYAQAIGWGTVVVTVAPIFGYAILNLYRAKGTVSQRISSLCRPTDTWGPCGDRMDCNYRKNKIKYSERTFWDLFYFNVFGRYPKNSAINLLLDHELTILKS